MHHRVGQAGQTVHRVISVGRGVAEFVGPTRVCDRADVARRVDSGTGGVNGYMPSLGSPFGGVKGSGMGSEFGPEAVNGYMRTKSIYVMG